MSDKLYVLLFNLIYYSALGLISYFVTPYVLLTLIIFQGQSYTKSNNVKNNDID